MILEAGIGLSRLGIEPRGWDLNLGGGGWTEDEKEEKKEKIPHM